MNPKIQILLIEDNRGDARLIREYLKEAVELKHDIFHVSRISEVQEVLDRERIDIILLDLFLPDSQGLDTFQNMLMRYPAYPIIVLTGLMDDAIGVRAVKAGAQDFLNKNELNSALLSKAIRYALNRHRMLRRLEEAQILAKMGNWELSLTSQRFYCSPQIYEIFATPPGFEFSTLEDYIASVHPEDQPTVSQGFESGRLNGTPFRIDHRIQDAEGRIKFVILNSRGEMDETGRTTRLVGTIQDITERKNIETLTREKDLAERSAKMKQEFLANTSHELRTPLNAILLLTQGLLKSPVSEMQREYLSLIKTAGDTLLTVVNDILDISKIEAGKIEFKYQTFDLLGALRSIQNLMKPKAKEKSLDFTLSLHPALPQFIEGDPFRFNQIMLNLLGNAFKFTTRGEVHIEAKPGLMQGNRVHVHFSISDTGIGIPEDQIGRIFDSFSQVDSDINRAVGGTGLGLAIVERLVRLQGGKISAKSTLGKGSEFEFVIPFLVSDASQMQTPDRKDYDSMRFMDLRILLVEDNPLNQMVVDNILKNWGIFTLIANNGREAVEILEEKSFDLVLMDLQMPEMDGYEATWQIRNKLAEPTASMPVVALTANAFPDRNRKYHESRMNDFLTKPVDLGLLFEKIIQYTGKVPFEAETNQIINRVSVPSGPEENGSAGKVTDLTYLKEITSGDNFVIKQTLLKFLETTPIIMEEMVQFLDEKEYDLLGKCAHKLKSSVGFMGMDAVRNSLMTLEGLSKTGEKPESISEMVSQIGEAVNRSYEELRENLKAFD